MPSLAGAATHWQYRTTIQRDVGECEAGSSAFQRPSINETRMTLSDAILVPMLADRIHGSDEAVRREGKNIVKKLPRSKRDIIYELISNPAPGN